jgi:hypothetical protein
MFDMMWSTLIESVAEAIRFIAWIVRQVISLTRKD